MADPNFIDTDAPRRNTDVDWEVFDSRTYFDQNYQHLLREDAEIIHIVAEFFQRAASTRRRVKAIDVGAGTNLYPALTMLPFASEIELCERAKTNRVWLDDQLCNPAPSWTTEFWTAIRGRRPAFHRIADPMSLLRQSAKVVQGNVFDLQPSQYGIGTMFFVAESITSSDDEFRKAVGCFARSLTPGAPFAMTFMRKSVGYRVGERWFPACPVDEAEVEECLAGVAEKELVRVVESKLHDGYENMIVAIGRRN